MKYKIISGLIILSVLNSCKDETKIIKKTPELKTINLIFPDTVYVNELYDGKIEYNNDLDTITTNLDDVKKARFLDYNFLLTTDVKHDVNYLKKNAKGNFVAETNRIIPLYGIMFRKLGLNYFDGIITDEVRIENGAQGKKGEPLTRIITDEIRLTRGVYVIERPSSTKSSSEK